MVMVVALLPQQVVVLQQADQAKIAAQPLPDQHLLQLEMLLPVEQDLLQLEMVLLLLDHPVQLPVTVVHLVRPKLVKELPLLAQLKLVEPD